MRPQLARLPEKLSRSDRLTHEPDAGIASKIAGDGLEAIQDQYHLEMALCDLPQGADRQRCWCAAAHRRTHHQQFEIGALASDFSRLD